MNIDRRAKSRHEIQLVCHIGTDRVVSKPVAGTVENISRGGILMRWEENIPLPETGSSLVVEVILPENSEFGARVMRCSTKVLRQVRRPGRRAMVALKIDQIRFVERSAAGHAFLAMPSASRRVN